jgi:hypothetical protein
MMDGHGLPPITKGCHSLRKTQNETLCSKANIEEASNDAPLVGSAVRPRARAFVIRFTLSLLLRHLGGYCDAIGEDNPDPVRRATWMLQRKECFGLGRANAGRQPPSLNAGSNIGNNGTI